MTKIDLSPVCENQEQAEIIAALAKVAADLSYQISLGPLAGDFGASIGEANAGGDQQKALDVMADEVFMEALKGTSLRAYASEEQDDIVVINENGKFALAIDPLDGSSNIDVNVSIGSIFSLLADKGSAEDSFLSKDNAQIAGGYFIYGPQCALVISFGNGTHQFILNSKENEFVYAGTLSIPEDTKEFAINASNHRHWPHAIRAYVDDCLAGETGPRGRNFNMRWVASLVAETHRILSRGGVFLYPSDERSGYEMGRLRMIYECAPIALLIEQAGGKATNGTDDILSERATNLHGRTGFVFGSKNEVLHIRNLYDLPKTEISPLFGERGLFG